MKRKYEYPNPRKEKEEYKKFRALGSYLRYLLDRVDNTYKRMFGFIPLVSSWRGERWQILVFPYIHVGDNPNVILLKSLELFSQLQRAVYGVGMRPPGRIVVSYPHVKLKGGYEQIIVLPHPYYRRKAPRNDSKMMLVPLKGMSLRLRYWEDWERRLAYLMASYGKKYPGILANSVLESLGSVYLAEEKGGPLVRSIRFVDRNNNQTEIDLLRLGNKGLELYEMKVSDGLRDPRSVLRKKLDTQRGVAEFYERSGVPVEYHLVLVGRDPEQMERNVRVAEELLSNHPMRVSGKGVHGILVRGKRWELYSRSFL